MEGNRERRERERSKRERERDIKADQGRRTRWSRMPLLSRRERRERERETEQRTQRRAYVSPPREFILHVQPVEYARVRVQSRSMERRRDDGMNIAVPSRPVRPIRGKRELREGGTRRSFAYVHPCYLLFSLQIRGKNDLSPDAAASPARAPSREEPGPGGGARRQRKKGKRREISAVNLLETPLPRDRSRSLPAYVVRACVGLYACIVTRHATLPGPVSRDPRARLAIYGSDGKRINVSIAFR